jgi:hypothetical protein
MVSEDPDSDSDAICAFALRVSGVSCGHIARGIDARPSASALPWLRRVRVWQYHCLRIRAFNGRWRQSNSHLVGANNFYQIGLSHSGWELAHVTIGNFYLVIDIILFFIFRL